MVDTLPQRLQQPGFETGRRAPWPGFTWASHQGAEIDLVLRRGERLFGVECRRADAPRMTPSIRIALKDLELQRVAVVYPGEQRYPIADRVEAVPLSDLATPGCLYPDPVDQ